MALAASLILVLSPSLRLKLLTDHATGTAELRDVRLPDGGTVRLGARSAIDVEFDPDRRIVLLVAGDAWFKVARDRAPVHSSRGRR